MDKTPKYIKMSDWPEVQEGWKPAWGDFVVEDGVVFTLSTTRVDKSKLIHLKRQDQLQEMEVDFNIYSQISRFDKWVHNDAFYQRKTMWESHEQLWLAFVMHELHGKVWDNEKEEWV